MPPRTRDHTVLSYSSLQTELTLTLQINLTQLAARSKYLHRLPVHQKRLWRCPAISPHSSDTTFQLGQCSSRTEVSRVSQPVERLRSKSMFLPPNMTLFPPTMVDLNKIAKTQMRLVNITSPSRKAEEGATDLYLEMQ